MSDLEGRIELLESEAEEDAKIIGSGAERELRLMARVEELERVLKRVKKVLKDDDEYGLYDIVCDALKGQP